MTVPKEVDFTTSKEEDQKALEAAMKAESTAAHDPLLEARRDFWKKKDLARKAFDEAKEAKRNGSILDGRKEEESRRLFIEAEQALENWKELDPKEKSKTKVPNGVNYKSDNEKDKDALKNAKEAASTAPDDPSVQAELDFWKKKALARDAYERVNRLHEGGNPELADKEMKVFQRLDTKAKDALTSWRELDAKERAKAEEAATARSSSSKAPSKDNPKPQPQPQSAKQSNDPAPAPAQKPQAETQAKAEEEFKNPGTFTKAANAVVGFLGAAERAYDSMSTGQKVAMHLVIGMVIGAATGGTGAIAYWGAVAAVEGVRAVAKSYNANKSQSVQAEHSPSAESKKQEEVPQKQKQQEVDGPAATNKKTQSKGKDYGIVVAVQNNAQVSASNAVVVSNAPRNSVTASKSSLKSDGIV